MKPAPAAESCFTIGASDGLSKSSIVARSPVWFLLSCCVLLMLMTFSPPDREPGVSSGATDAVAKAKAGARAVVLLGLCLFVLRRWNSPRRRAVIRQLTPWILFASWAVVSTVWSPLKSVSLGQSASFVILLLLAVAVALSVGRQEVESIFKGLTAALCVTCAIMILIFFAMPQWGSLSRAGSGLLHATNASATASLGCVILIACRLLYEWRWARVFFTPGLAIFTATLLLAQSRTAIAMTGLVCGGLIIGLLPALWRAVGLAAFGLFGTLYLALDLGLDLSTQIANELTTYAARGQTAQQLAQLSGREEMWRAMWDSFRESPWIGHGYFVSSSSGELYVWYLWGNWTAHNFWLQILVSVGIAGCVLMANAMLRLALDLVRGIRQGKWEWQFAVLVGSVMCWQIGWGVNNESFVGPLQPESVVYLVIVGLVAARGLPKTVVAELARVQTVNASL